MKSPNRLDQAEDLFNAALERKPEERANFLAQACGTDQSLHDAVNALLAAHEESWSMLDQRPDRDAPANTSDPTKNLPFAAARPPVPNPGLHSSGDEHHEGRFVAGTMLAGRYRIVGLLGKGGMGEVYKAEDLKLGQTVALKFLPESIALDGAMLARFHNEVRIARQVAHPNVCRVYDIGEAEGLHFLSMEFIDGEDLSSLLRRIKRLPGDKAVELARQLCAGLAAAHELGVLHRDLKPANVMIDGRGKARITDFGLAVVSEELRGAEAMAGTPAYMAPEQLTGKEVTQRSDIYALGLVLYELFTGKRVFEAKSIRELISLHEKSTPPTPSNHVKDIDPLAERVIMRCLEKDPQVRPTSAIQVAAALPGGDPLQAALLAGETPSPEMVAAAGEKTGLRPAYAVACLVAIIIGLIAVAFLNRKVNLIEQVPFDNPPEALARKAREIVVQLGYPRQPVDSAYWLTYNQPLLRYYERNYPPQDRWRFLSKGLPPAIGFTYRESPRYLQTTSIFSNGSVTPEDPQWNISGMAFVTLDTLGRLHQFGVMPPQVEKPPASPSPPDWKVPFTLAGLDLARFTPAEPEWMPYVPGVCDVRVAWTGSYADLPEMPIRVEAASYHGKIVSFNVIKPYTFPGRMQIWELTTGQKAANIIWPSLLSIILVGASLLARYNLRRGRGDRQGAFRLAAFIFAVNMLVWLLQASHVPTRHEISLFVQAISAALFEGGVTWLLYIALEPFVRRRWPVTLISWSRVLAGDFRDPRVGRDVLLGCVFVIHLLIAQTFVILAQLKLGAAPYSGTRLSALLGTHYLIGQSLFILYDSVRWALGIFFLIFLLRVLLRRQWLAASVFVLIATITITLTLGSNYPLTDALSYFLAYGLFTIVLLRFGLVSLIVSGYVGDLLSYLPVTSNLSTWYGGSSLFVMLAVLALALWAFHTSLGGQKVFQEKLLED